MFGYLSQKAKDVQSGYDVSIYKAMQMYCLSSTPALFLNNLFLDLIWDVDVCDLLILIVMFGFTETTAPVNCEWHEAVCVWWTERTARTAQGIDYT